MTRRLAVCLALVAAAPAVAAAFDDSGHFARVLHCINHDGSVGIELYLPSSVAYGKGALDNPRKPVTGCYSLDLEKIGKGKPLEPVKVWRDEKAKVLVVDQYTRGLPKAKVPLDGGIVDFDKDFAGAMRCKPYNLTREDEMAEPFPPVPGEAGPPAGNAPAAAPAP
jgi:hypothetical protein